MKIQKKIKKIRNKLQKIRKNGKKIRIFSFKPLFNFKIVWYNEHEKKGSGSMATIFDVAKYILTSLGSMSSMKLQKLCYYAQAWSLVWDDMPLFEEDFQAWANGPVCPELFRYTQGRFSVSESDEKGDINNLSDFQIDTIEAVLNHYGDKSAQWLSQLTHMEDPWNEARIGVPAGMGCSNVISKESMSIYYGAL